MIILVRIKPRIEDTPRSNEEEEEDVQSDVYSGYASRSPIRFQRMLLMALLSNLKEYMISNK